MVAMSLLVVVGGGGVVVATVAAVAVLVVVLAIHDGSLVISSCCTASISYRHAEHVPHICLLLTDRILHYLSTLHLDCGSYAINVPG